MSGAPQYVYFFGDGSSEGDPERKDLLGGKGASLAAMSRAGFPVPPGFTISSECCALAEANNGRWPEGLEEQVRGALARLEAATGRRFGAGPQPLLVAVRSGAGVSMPGMMDTILNCGLTVGSNDVDSAGHDAASRSEDFAEHVRMFAASVAGLKLDDGEGPGDDVRSRARQWIARYEQHTGRRFPTEPWDALRQCIDAVFASWHSERARAYRQRHDVRGLAGTAVNVQSMFPSERSGVLFTMNPQSPDAGEMILEASWGLGEAVVSGAVTPDIFVVDRETLAVRRTIPGERRDADASPRTNGHAGPATASELSLNEPQVREIAELGRRIEQHFGVPSDIEWGIADGKVALLQTRAIRGLDALRATEQLRQSEIARLKLLAGDRHIVWVVHNLGETLPHPTPLTWDIIRWFMSGDGGFGQLYRQLGFRPRRDVCERGFLELIAGRIYVDPERAAGLFWGDLPYEYDPQEILADRQTLEQPPSKLNFERADPLLFLKLPGLMWAMWRSSRLMRRMRAKDRNRPHPLLERFRMKCQAPLERFLSGQHGGVGGSPLLRGPSHSFDTSSGVGALCDELDRGVDFVLGDFAAESLIPGFFAGVALDELRQWLVQIFGSERCSELCGALTAGLDGDVTVEQNERLFQAARRVAGVERSEPPAKVGGESAGGSQSLDPSHPVDALEEFVRVFGHRAAEEMELAQPRWREDRSFLERMVAGLQGSHAVSPAVRHAEQARRRHEAETQLPGLLAEHGASSLRERIERLVFEAQTLLPFRETGKFHLMRGYETIRQVLVRLGEQTGFGRDLFFLRRSELRDLATRADELRGVAARRKAEWEAARKLAVADLIDSHRLDELGRPPARRAAGDGHYVARPIAAGTARGVARIVHRPGEAGNLGTGFILVCPSTDPGWTPLFLHCRGLVVERGGILSHGAIVARDFGIPAVVLENATQLIADGTTIEIDGNSGAVVVN